MLSFFTGLKVQFQNYRCKNIGNSAILCFHYLLNNYVSLQGVIEEDDDDNTLIEGTTIIFR